MEWQPIETAPDDVLHVRGMWVYCAYKNMPIYFTVDAGYVDEEGDFRTTSGDDTGWRAEDYQFWAPLPKEIPEIT